MRKKDNVSRHQLLQNAFRNADVNQINDLLSDKVKWHINGRSKIAGTYNGKEEFFKIFGQLAQCTNGSLKMSNHVFMGDNDLTISRLMLSAKSSDKELSVDMFECIRWEDGKVVEHWNSSFNQYAYDEFWGVESK